MSDQHVVMFSGGVGSWATAKRVAERHGTDGLTLLFADTKMEDPDLYRFLDEAAANVGGDLVKIEDGRDVWDVFFDVRFLGNSRVDPCSRILKRELMKTWMRENRDPETTTIYLGIDWTESHRMDRAAQNHAPFRVEAPMCEAPHLTKPEVFDWLTREGIEVPALYKLGFHHNNCGGFCVKSGQAQFENLLRKRPETYAYHEAREQEIREFLGKDVAVLRDRRGGGSRPMTLREFRERIEGQPDLFDKDEWGGCGCAI